MDDHATNVPIDWSGYLTLVRHGQTDFNVQGRFLGRTNRSLDDTGREQANDAARFLEAWTRKTNTSFEVLLSSPLRRCIETAQPIAKILSLSILEESLLIERHYGVFEGKSREEVESEFPEIFAKYRKEKPFVELPEGETALQVEERVRKLLFEVFPEKYDAINEILIVTHLNPIRAVFHLLGLADWSIYFQAFHNTSISRIRVSPQRCEFEFCDKPLV